MGLLKINEYKDYLLDHIYTLIEHYKDEEREDKINIANDIVIEVKSTSDEDKLQNIAERVDYLIRLTNIKKSSI